MVQVYLVPGARASRKREMKIYIGHRHMVRDGTGGVFSVPRKRKAFGENCTDGTDGGRGRRTEREVIVGRG